MVVLVSGVLGLLVLEHVAVGDKLKEEVVIILPQTEEISVQKIWKQYDNATSINVSIHRDKAFYQMQFKGPINSQWASGWSRWSSCANGRYTCGNGRRSRTRRCNVAQNGGSTSVCTGTVTETEKCTMKDCKCLINDV